MNGEQWSRLALVRAAMAQCPREGGAGVDALIVLGADEHQNEYVPSHNRRREWLTGFTGSAGDAVVTKDAAWLWTDGRYWAQAERELAGSGIELVRSGEEGAATMSALLRGLGGGAVVGVDARTMTLGAFEELDAALRGAGARLAALERSPVDASWRDRPAARLAPVVEHPLEFAGQSAHEKLERVRDSMRTAGASAHVISALDAVAWLLNLRGSDVEHNPVFLAHVVVTLDDATLFTDGARLTGDAREALRGVTDVRPYEAFEGALAEMAADATTAWWIDAQATSARVGMLVGAARIRERGVGPVTRFKAVKNEVELRGMREAHARDGAATARFLRWFEREAARGGETEISARDALERERGAEERHVGPAFATISGAGPNGAVVHYRVTDATSRAIAPDDLYLIDSGAHYLDGTTDVTRTLCAGTPRREFVEHCTLVLKAHIALASARFPRGVTGQRLDALARAPLWAHGLDFAHGTGHGVGAYLCVHERPPNISARPVAATALEAGMVVSIEPGVYVNGSHGVRIENLYEVVEDGSASAGGGWLRFEALTMVPMQRSLIDVSMLDAREVAWLDAYHARVREVVGPRLRGEERAWLESR